MAGEGGRWPSRPPGGWLLLASASAVTAACYLAIRRPRHDASTTQFDLFLKTPPAPAHQQAAAGSKRVAVTQFAAFLKSTPAEPDSCDFSSFLKSASNATGTHGDAQPEAPPAEEVPLDRARVLVVFGTEYGFSKEIAEKLCAQLKEGSKCWPHLVDMADHPDGYDLSLEQALIVVCSTQGDGVPPSEAREFCEWLFSGKAGPLAHMAYSVCALGDRAYTHFCRCGRQVDAALQGAGAQPMAARVDVNREDWGAVDAWISAVVQALTRMELKSMAETGGIASAAAAKPAAKRWGKSRPYYARVVAVDSLCTVSSPEDKGTVRVELDLGSSGLSYEPGDALGIYPSNAPEAVEQVLQALGATGEEQVPAPSWHYQDARDEVQASGMLALRHALTNCYDLRQPREQMLLAALLAALPASSTDAAGNNKASEDVPSSGADTVPAPAAAVAMEGTVALPLSDSVSSLVSGATAADKSSSSAVQRLRHLLDSPAALAEYFAARHVVDVLREFRASALALGAGGLLPTLRALQPRLYSISSSPLEAASRVQATIAVVRYECLGAPRLGVCSTYVAERIAPGSLLPVFISKNPDFRLPVDAGTPIIMVGPGTGLAPFRAFIKHRLLQTAVQKAGPMVLYFGCRRSDQDYLYGADLEAWAADGSIKLYTAFSRQQAQKVYVQQRLCESGAEVWRLLQDGAHFYVCGDAGSMASAVEAALLDIVAQHQGLGRDAARAYLDDLAPLRYQRDVWLS